MGLYVFDGHGLWTLQAFSDFNSDGSLKRGFYFKKTSEQAGDMTSELTGSNLLRLEHAEEITRAKLRDSGSRQGVLDKLSDANYRGALIYAAVDDGSTNFGLLYTRMNNAKREWDETAKEAGLPVPPAYVPGPIIKPVDPNAPPADTRPEWQKLNFASKSEWKAWRDAGSPAR
jgi:hypothetical protein